MKPKCSKLLMISFVLMISSNAFSQYRANIKTNVFSLLLTIPQASLEVSLGNSSSITLSAFKGSYTFISESKVRGANLLLRKYISGKEGLSGIYGEAGFVIDGEYLAYKDEWDDDFGGRLGVGWQFGGPRMVFDIGAALATTQGKYEVFDTNGQPSGEFETKFDAFIRLNASVGFRF